MTMFNDECNSMETSFQTVPVERLEQVQGGLKWSPVENSDVIDARGGQFTILGYVTVSLDGNGKISDVTIR
jgi:hypothetical protein